MSPTPPRWWGWKLWLENWWITITVGVVNTRMDRLQGSFDTTTGWSNVIHYLPLVKNHKVAPTVDNELILDVTMTHELYGRTTMHTRSPTQFPPIVHLSLLVPWKYAQEENPPSPSVLFGSRSHREDLSTPSSIRRCRHTTCLSTHLVCYRSVRKHHMIVNPSCVMYDTIPHDRHVPSVWQTSLSSPSLHNPDTVRQPPTGVTQVWSLKKKKNMALGWIWRETDKSPPRREMVNKCVGCYPDWGQWAVSLGPPRGDVGARNWTTCWVCDGRRRTSRSESRRVPSSLVEGRLYEHAQP